MADTRKYIAAIARSIVANADIIARYQNEPVSSLRDREALIREDVRRLGDAIRDLGEQRGDR